MNSIKKLQLEIEKIEIQKKNEELLKKEAERRKIYEKYLLRFQGGSNVLRDFHTNLF